MSAPAAPDPLISVVVGSQNARETIAECLSSIKMQLNGRPSEIVVADGSTDGTTEIIEERFPDVVLIKAGTDSLVPHLWGMAMDRCQAPIVAVTTANCIPKSDWIDSILSLADKHRDFEGFGGAIEGPIDGSAKDWAVYFSRFSAFMPPVKDGTVPDVPGDNAAYRKAALDRCWNDRNTGFWETIFHNALRASGANLYMSPSVEVRLGKTGSAADYFRIRYKHGIHYGSTRPNNAGVAKLLRICAAPILMPYLVLRIGKRVSERKPEWITQYITSLPWLIYFTTAWSAGEVCGYLGSVQNEPA